MTDDLHEHGRERAKEELLPRHRVDSAERTFDSLIVVGVESFVQGNGRQRRGPNGGRWVY